MRSVYQDIQFGLRLLRNSPGFTLSAILTLVAGVLLNTAAFGLVNALWFGKLPFRDDQRVVVVGTAKPGFGTAGVSWSDYEAARTQTPAFSGMAAFHGRMYNVSFPSAGALPEQVSGGLMSASTLEVLGYTPVVGRGFTPEEEGSYSEAGGPPVVLISEGLWRRRFGAEASAVGRRLGLDGAPATIIGVLPPSFRFVYGGYQVIAPLSREARAERYLQVLARLRPGMSLELANRQLEVVSARLSRPDGGVLLARPYRQAVFAEALRMYPILLAGALLLLLLVCANVSNLLLAKTAARSQEIAIRLALGAARGRIVRQLITEGALLAGIGAAVSLLLAAWMRQMIVARVAELSVFAVDARVALYTLAIALFAGVTFGVAPALRSTRPQVSDTLKGRCRLRSAMMAAQVAVAMVLLTGTGLLLRSMANLRYVDKGLDLDGVVATTVQLRGRRYAETGQRLRFWRQLAESVAAVPGVDAAGVTGAVPLTNMPGAQTIEVEGRPVRAGSDVMRLADSVADGRYMAVVRRHLLAGRGFTASDGEGAPRVAMINEALARRFWPEDPRQALGRRMRVGGGEWSTVVGITRNARQFLMFPPAAEVIVPVAQAPERASTLVVRAKGLGRAAVRQIVLRELQRLDADLPAGEFLDEAGIIEMFYPKVMLAGLGILAAAAMGLAALGLYGVVSFIVAGRTREVGIRMALGATGRSIVALVLRDGLRTVLAGMGVGMAGSLALARGLGSLLFDVRATDPMAYAAAAGVVLGVALPALLAPALRASHTEPGSALRTL